jgi:small GTP-binding protein
VSDARLDAVLDASRGLLDVSALSQTVALWRCPWRIAIVGRTSTGKSTLVNLLTGHNTHPTGLGGVTLAPKTVRIGSVEVIDTPGIDDENQALTVLQPLLETVDSVIWIIDGLQPLTATERRVMDLAWVEDTPLHLLVSRLDLADPEDVPAVLERVEALTSRYAPLSLRRADLRHLKAPPDGLLEAGPSPRRTRALRQALDDLEAALGTLPEAASPADIRARVRELWRSSVRSSTAHIEADILGGRIDHKDQAIQALLNRSNEIAQTFREQLELFPPVATHLAAVGPPSLPIPVRQSRTPLRYVLAGMSGAEGARRALKGAAAQWMADGEIAVLDWLETIQELGREHQRRQRLRDAIHCARPLSRG